MKTFLEKANRKRLLLKRGQPEEIFSYADLVEVWHEGYAKGLSMASEQVAMLGRVAKMNKHNIVEQYRRKVRP